MAHVDGDLGHNLAHDNLEPLITTAWVAPTLLNGWLNFGAPYQAARYKRIGGVVFVQGLLKSGTVTAGTTLFVLPAGFRPAATVTFTSNAGTGALLQINVDSSGNVTAGSTLSAANTPITLQFPADA